MTSLTNKVCTGGIQGRRNEHSMFFHNLFAEGIYSSYYGCCSRQPQRTGLSICNIFKDYACI